jgi:uncharacterized membrane protein (UPF0127 family)
MGYSNAELGLIGVLGLGVLAISCGAAAAACAPDTVELRTAAGNVVRFSTEVADTEAERALGLMNRPKMATSAGMLFVYPEPKHAFFWMQNTLIPLDMIFADATGLVKTVHSNAVPLDETPIDGGADVTYVLEINGGLAKRMGLTAGTVLRANILEQSGAIWPCSSE